MIDLLFRKGYQGTMEFRGTTYYGEVKGHHITYSGKNVQELRENFEKAVDLYIELQQEV